MSVPMRQPHESHGARVAAVVASLAAGLFLLPPLGALVAIGCAFWIKQRRTRIALLAIAAGWVLFSVLFLVAPWAGTSSSGGGNVHP